jgi:hypothetical protein
MSAGLGFTMNDHPQDSVYSFVERAYMRLQAGDILTRCLEDGRINPIQDLVEGLVLAGPKNLDSLREILDEAGQRKTQVGDDLHQVFTQFSSVFMSYGVLIEGETADTVQRWTAGQLLDGMRQQGVYEADVQTACLQVWQDSREILDNLSTKLDLLEEIELYLQDWLWGLAYKTIHRHEESEISDIGEQPQ